MKVDKTEQKVEIKKVQKNYLTVIDKRGKLIKSSEMTD